MKNFKNRDSERGGFGGNRGSREERGGKPAFYGKSRGGDRSTDREQRMFKAVCSDCNKSCDVPFKPSSDKPVFCRDCFSAKRDRETREYKAGLAHGEPKKFVQDKPTTYTNSAHTSFAPSHVDENIKKQLAEMNARIDKLTILVEKMIEEKSASVSVKNVTPSPVKKVTAKAVVKKVVAKVEAVKKVVVAKNVVAKKTVAKKLPAKKVVAVKKVAAKVTKKVK